MNNIINGSVTIGICIILIILSYRYYIKKKYLITLIFILLAGLSIRIYISLDGYLHTWDERYHALVAKNLIKHPYKPTLYENPVLSYDNKNWTANHIWLEKGPVPLLFASLSIGLFGNTEFPVRAPSILISLSGVFLTYLIASSIFNRKVALLASFFHAINGLIVELAGGRVSSDMVETSFIVFTELSVFFALKSTLNIKSILYPVFVGVSCGLAVLCKWSPAFIVFPVWAVAEYYSKTKPIKTVILHFITAFFVTLAVIAPWLINIIVHFPEEANYVLKKFLYAYSGTIEGHGGPAYYYLTIIGMIFGELIWIPIVFSFYHIISKKANWKILTLSSWWIIPLLIFSLAVTKRYTYLLIAAPALFIIQAYYWFYIYELRLKVRYKWLLFILLFAMLALPVRYSIERAKPFKKIDKSPSWATELKSLNGKFPEDGKTIIFNTEHYIEGMYYTEYTFYPFIPEQELIDSLRNNGYRVFLYQEIIKAQ